MLINAENMLWFVTHLCEKKKKRFERKSVPNSKMRGNRLGHRFALIAEDFRLFGFI